MKMTGAMLVKMSSVCTQFI